MSKPRRRIWKSLAIFVIVLMGAGTVGFLYLRATTTTAAAEQADSSDGDTASDDADATATDADDTAAEKTDGESEDGEDETRVPVSIAEVRRGSVSSYVSATANLVAENEVMVIAETEGRLLELHAEEGDFVEKGQILAVLMRDDEQIAFDKAQVKAANAELAFERSNRLATQGLIPDEELQKNTMEHRVSQQELAEAQWNLEKTEIRAPFSGRITARNITVGQHIQISDELFTVTDFDLLVARIYLPEKDIIGLTADREVTIKLQADDEVEFLGRIRRISPVVDVATGTVKLTVEAVEPPRQVRPGGFVDIDIVRETRPQAVLLPREALIRELQRAHVFVVDDGKAVKRDITLGLEEGDYVEILSGLDAGESVIIAGQGGLKDGAAVKVIEDPTNIAASSDQSEDSPQS